MQDTLLFITISGFMKDQTSVSCKYFILSQTSLQEEGTYSITKGPLAFKKQNEIREIVSVTIIWV